MNISAAPNVVNFEIVPGHSPTFVLVDVERMLDESHPARAIWDLLGGLDPNHQLDGAALKRT
ncbi:MAG: hypothetical protein U5J83_00830 [Bryobacterales bacterium]|nr:hypothetical protein [Bryobacterales bacterium]